MSRRSCKRSQLYVHSVSCDISLTCIVKNSPIATLKAPASETTVYHETRHQLLRAKIATIAKARTNIDIPSPPLGNSWLLRLGIFSLASENSPLNVNKLEKTRIRPAILANVAMARYQTLPNTISSTPSRAGLGLTSSHSYTLDSHLLYELA